MSEEILNLDELVPADKKVIFGGRKIIIPGQVPVSIMLKLISVEKKLQESPDSQESIEASFKAMYSVLEIKNEGLTYEWVMEHLSLQQFEPLMSYIFNAGQKKTQESSEPPTETQNEN